MKRFCMLAQITAQNMRANIALKRSVFFNFDHVKGVNRYETHARPITHNYALLVDRKVNRPCVHTKQ